MKRVDVCITRGVTFSTALLSSPDLSCMHAAAPVDLTSRHPPQQPLLCCPSTFYPFQRLHFCTAATLHVFPCTCFLGQRAVLGWCALYVFCECSDMLFVCCNLFVQICLYNSTCGNTCLHLMSRPQPHLFRLSNKDATLEKKLLFMIAALHQATSSPSMPPPFWWPQASTWTHIAHKILHWTLQITSLPCRKMFSDS